MSTVVPDFNLRVTDANGNPISGGKMYFFVAGTTNAATVYSDKDLTIAHAQPVVADASGWIPAVYAPNGDYKIRMADAAGVTIREIDYITIAAAGGALPLSLTVVGKTANYTLVAGDRGRVFECDASGAPGQQIVITADSNALGNGWPVWIANSGASGSVVIQPAGGQTVVYGGTASSSYTLTGRDQIVGMVSRGAAGWRIFTVAGGVINFVDPIIEPGTALTDGATITPDFAQDSTFTVTLGGNRTMAMPTNLAVGQRVRFIISQDATGGRTLAWAAGYNWIGGLAPILVTTANNREIFDGRVISASVIDMWKINAGTYDFSKSFVSADQTITSAGLLTLAHGLGIKPAIIQYRLKCATAEFGYAINDEIDPSMFTQDLNDGSTGSSAVVVADATNISVRFGNAASTFRGMNFTTGAYAALTNANWKFIVRAYA